MKMRKIKVTTIALIVLTTLSGCKSYYESLFRTQDLDERFRGAMYYYGNGKYRKAASLFESMIFLSQGTDKEDIWLIVGKHHARVGLNLLPVRY